MVAAGVLVIRSLVVSGRHAPNSFVVVVVCSWVEYQQAYRLNPAHGNPEDSMCSWVVCGGGVVAHCWVVDQQAQHVCPWWVGP